MLLLWRTGDMLTFMFVGQQFFQHYNGCPFYANIIDQFSLDDLPVDGIPTEHLSATEPEEQLSPTTEGQEGNADDNDPAAQETIPTNSHSFLPLSNRTAVESEAIRAALTDEDPLAWPNIAGQLIKQLATMLYQTRLGQLPIPILVQ